MKSNGAEHVSRVAVPVMAEVQYRWFMDDETRRKATPLIRVVALLQIKLLLGAGRDLVLGPVALAAAVLDLVLLKGQEPQYFRAVLRFGERTDAWIDTWSHGRGDATPPRGSVDALLASVEDVVRDPQSGARRARVLKRWAERQVSRARQHAATQRPTRGDSERLR